LEHYRAPPQAVVQRLAVPVNFSEKLQTDTPGTPTGPPPATFTPGTFGQKSTFQLTRDGNNVSVSVRIRFKDPNGTAIPESDARRGVGAGFCTSLAPHWNDKYELVGDPKPAGSGSTGGSSQSGGVPAGAGTSPAFRLPIVFSATPVWDLSAQADADVKLHPGAANPSAGNPIDSQNWYTSSGTGYGTTPPDVIYAHEYGHLLGIPDEYSQSNADMHARLHIISPTEDLQMGAALDKVEIRKVILDAIQPQLQIAIQGISGAVAEAVGGERASISSHLTDGLRTAWRNPTVIAGLVGMLQPQVAARSRVSGALARAVRFEAVNNMSYLDVVHQEVDRQLRPASMRNLLTTVFQAAAAAAQQAGATVNIPHINERSQPAPISMSIETIGVSGADPFLDTAAILAATASTGIARPTPPGRRRRPPLYPSSTLIGKLTQLPATWHGTTAAFSGQVAAIPVGILANAIASFSVAPLVPTTVAQLYRDLYNRFGAIAHGVAFAALQDFLTGQFRPLLDQQINDLLAMVSAEVDSHQTVPPGGGTNAAPNPPPDPALLAAVQLAVARAKVMATAPATASTSHVRATINSLMGDDNVASGVRADYMGGIVKQFNDHVPDLRHRDEGDFQVRTK
jgi:hypothetical protein